MVMGPDTQQCKGHHHATVTHDHTSATEKQNKTFTGACTPSENILLNLAEGEGEIYTSPSNWLQLLASLDATKYLTCS